MNKITMAIIACLGMLPLLPGTRIAAGDNPDYAQGLSSRSDVYDLAKTGGPRLSWTKSAGD